MLCSILIVLVFKKDLLGLKPLEWELYLLATFLVSSVVLMTRHSTGLFSLFYFCC